MKDNNRVIRAIRKRFKPGILLLFIVMFSANTFAWFVYTSKVDTGIDVHVKSWNIDFVADSAGTAETVRFNVDNIYPGMIPYVDSIGVRNSGDTTAKISYQIQAVKIKLNGEEYYEGGGLTSQMIEDKLLNTYPFKIAMYLDNDIVKKNEEAVFNLGIEWNYESGDDDLDTIWGNYAYEFEKRKELDSNLRNTPCIEISIRLIATQYNE